MLVQLAELGPRGKLVDVIEPSNVELGEPTPNRYARIYVSHPGGEPPQPGDRMLIWRVDRRLKPYGHVVRPTGMATVAAVHEDVSTAVIVEVFDRVQLGNQLSLIQPFHMERGVFAAPVAAGPTGELVALLDEQVMPTVEDIAFVNVGLSEGVALGDEFEIYLAIRRSREELRLPEEHIATGRVVRVTEETSTLRVIEQRHPAIRAGLPVRLVRKMPS